MSCHIVSEGCDGFGGEREWGYRSVQTTADRREMKREERTTRHAKRAESETPPSMRKERQQRTYRSVHAYKRNDEAGFQTPFALTTFDPTVATTPASSLSPSCSLRASTSPRSSNNALRSAMTSDVHCWAAG